MSFTLCNKFIIIIIKHLFPGEWLSIVVHIAKQFGYKLEENDINNTFKWSEISLEYLKLQNLHYFWLGACSFSYGVYFIIGGFLHVGINTFCTCTIDR